MATSKRVTLIIFILYFLPAIPYGMICFFAASFGLKYPRYITVTLLGAIPSICIGVGLGHVAIASSLALSITVCALLLAVIIVIMIKRNAIFNKVNEFIDGTQDGKFKVKKYSRIKLSIAYVISRIVFFLRGVKVKYVRRVDKLETPSIVLSTHGSFIDFAYAGSLTKETAPNFIVARLYFYKNIVGSFIREFGCFPKSMFAGDIESAKNCLSVIKGGGVLAMMPEARLSTAGKFEDIQPGTYDFIKKMGVTVYSVNIGGNYLASPKWGDGLRRGSLVEAELDILFTKEEIRELSVEEIKERCERRLYYDDLKWLEEHPEVRYKKKTLAEGLENILVKCPKCKELYTIRAKGHDIFCDRCGKLATLSDRYLFDTDAPFSDFGKWYDWQFEEMKREILDDPDYALTSKVTFKLPSKDGRTMLYTAGEGVCTLNREGLTYVGTKDGEEVTLTFPIKNLYRLLFGAGESFEVYVGRTIHFFLPEEGRSAVSWYIASLILNDLYEARLLTH
jgi:1-acyl-sn-glycerol-3-phosphate acyltransferase